MKMWYTEKKFGPQKFSHYCVANTISLLYEMSVMIMISMETV